MGNKDFVPDAVTAASMLRERHGDAVAAEFERLVAEGRKLQAVRYLRTHGVVEQVQ